MFFRQSSILSRINSSSSCSGVTWRRPSLAWVLALTEEEWRAATRLTALRRSRYRGLLRNALVVAGNCGDPSLAPLLERHAAGPDPLLAEHARWALEKLTVPASGH